jgi:anaerobic sulfite reductase subunit B
VSTFPETTRPATESHRGSMTPVPHRVTSVVHETRETVTLALEPVGDGVPAPTAGQFTMLWAWGAGEVPISVSALREGGLVHTIRDVAGVTKTLCASRPGDVLGVRGPYGRGWGVDAARGHDLVLVAGGIGLAPLRPVVHAVLADRAAFGRVFVVVGARTEQELLFRGELDGWWHAREVTVRTIVDRSSPGWSGSVGVVTGELVSLDLDPASTYAMVCGPEVMMRVVAQHLTDRGVAASSIEVSLERNMQCAVKTCGHCQIGPFFACTDGPVLTWDVVDPLLTVREL